MLTQMQESEGTSEVCPPEHSPNYRVAIYEAALRQIASVDWPVNVYGKSPQKIASEALKQ